MLQPNYWKIGNNVFSNFFQILSSSWLDVPFSGLVISNWSFLLFSSLVLLCNDRTVEIRSIFNSLTNALYFVRWLMQLQGENLISKCKVKILHQQFVDLNDSASLPVRFDFIDFLHFQLFMWKIKLIVEFMYFLL